MTRCVPDSQLVSLCQTPSDGQLRPSLKLHKSSKERGERTEPQGISKKKGGGGGGRSPQGGDRGGGEGDSKSSVLREVTVSSQRREKTRVNQYGFEDGYTD